MRSKKGNGGGIIVGVLAVLLLGTILYTTVVPGSDSDTDDVAPEGDFVLLDTNPPQLAILEHAPAYNWSESHTGIELSGIPVTEGTELADRAVVTSGWFSGDDFTQGIVIRNNTVAAKLTFNVLDKEGGTLKVEFNGASVYSKEPKIGDTIEIDLPVISPGEENQISISVSKPFWPWDENSYGLEGVYIDEYLYKGELASQNVTFSLARDQVIGLSSAKLFADVEMLDDVENKKITVTLNSEVIYDNVPGAVHGAIEASLPIRSFMSGDNSLVFKTSLNGGYLIDFDLELEMLNLTQESYEVYEVRVADNIWPQVQAGQENKGYWCELYLERSSGADAVTVWINDRRQSLAFDANNEISQDVCGFLEEGKNTIMLIADTEGSASMDFIDVEQLRLAILEK